MRSRLSSWLLIMTLALPALASAEFCAERAAAALEELATLAGPVGGAQAEATRGVLLRLCEDARLAAAAAIAAVPDEGARAAAARHEEAPPARMLGVEFRKAAPDSAGNQRLRRRP